MDKTLHQWLKWEKSSLVLQQSQSKRSQVPYPSARLGLNTNLQIFPGLFCLFPPRDWQFLPLSQGVTFPQDQFCPCAGFSHTYTHLLQGFNPHQFDCSLSHSLQIPTVTIREAFLRKSERRHGGIRNALPEPSSFRPSLAEERGGVTYKERE